MNPEYRLYYDEDGNVLFSTGSGYPEQGAYILIPKELYVAVTDWRHHKVINGVLKEVESIYKLRVQLEVANSGWKVVRDHAGILIESSETYTEIEYYAKPNS